MTRAFVDGISEILELSGIKENFLKCPLSFRPIHGFRQTTKNDIFRLSVTYPPHESYRQFPIQWPEDEEDVRPHSLIDIEPNEPVAVSQDTDLARFYGIVSRTDRSFNKKFKWVAVV